MHLVKSLPRLNVVGFQVEVSSKYLINTSLQQRQSLKVHRQNALQYFHCSITSYLLSKANITHRHMYTLASNSSQRQIRQSTFNQTTPIVHRQHKRELVLHKFNETFHDQLEQMHRLLPPVNPSSVRHYLSSNYAKYLQLLNIESNKFTHFYTQQKLSLFGESSVRTMSTYQKKKSNGSGMPIKDDKELLDPKGIKHLKLNACGQLYEELSKTQPLLYGSAPVGKGIDFHLEYYDSGEILDPTVRSDAPVVCLLHGAPGHFKDFQRLIKHLSDRGIRVVSPNLPDYSATIEHGFRHSPRERVDYLLKFFEALEITKIDMMIGHSAAVYTIFELLAQAMDSNPSIISPKIVIKSLGLLSSPSYNLPPNMAVTPFRLFTLKLFDYPLLRPIIMALIHVFVKIQGIQNKVDKSNIDNLLVSASVVGYSNNQLMKDRIKIVTKFNIPTLVSFGHKDRLIPKETFEQLKRDLGVLDSNQVKCYDKNGKLVGDESKICKKHLIQVTEFEDGGHYAFQKFSELLNEDVYNFLIGKVCKRTPVESTYL